MLEIFKEHVDLWIEKFGPCNVAFYLVPCIIFSPFIFLGLIGYTVLHISSNKGDGA